MDDLPSEMPPVRISSHHIDLILGSSFPNKFSYHMAPKKNEEVRKQVQELLDKGLIRESLTQCAVPIALIPKKDGGWWTCIDSIALNKTTIRYHFPLPYIDDLLDCLSGVSWFSKIGLKSGYNQIIIRE